jgi:alpha-tubulin suppressor-like RCC1 family protein
MVAVAAGAIGVAGPVGASPVNASSHGGARNSAAASTDSVDRWGSFFSPNYAQQKKPTPVGTVNGVTQVAASNGAAYALLSNGTVWAIGETGQGELGNGGTAKGFTLTPVQVTFPAGVDIVALANPDPFNGAVAIDSNGNAWGWGDNRNGNLCLGNTTVQYAPVELPLSGITAAAGAGGHMLYLTSSGTVEACGDNTLGELGNGTQKNSTKAVTVNGLSGVTAVTASYANSGALLSDGTFWTWGVNTYGQIGDSDTGVQSDVPFQVPLPAPVVEAYQGGDAASNGQAIVLLSDGSVWAWGDDAYAQLGDQSTTNEGAPIQIQPPAGVTYTDVVSGGTTSYAIDSAGNVWAWGSNGGGQIGNGKSGGYVQVPVEVDSGVDQLVSTANNAADHHSG